MPVPASTTDIALDPRRAAGLEGAPNTRDLGGYRVAGRQRVRWGVLYRGMALTHLVGDDDARLRALSLGTVMDLRPKMERASRPSHLASAARASIEWAPNWRAGAQLTAARQAMGAAVAAGPGPAFEAMRQVYARLPVIYAGALKTVVKTVLSGDAPVLFHCAAGKDRTGVLAALLLGLLGARRDVMMADYMLSATLLSEESRLHGVAGAAPKAGALRKSNAEALKKVAAADPRYLSAALASVRKSHGAFEDFALKAAGLKPRDIEAFREMTLEDDPEPRPKPVFRSEGEFAATNEPPAWLN